MAKVEKPLNTYEKLKTFKKAFNKKNSFKEYYYHICRFANYV